MLRATLGERLGTVANRVADAFGRTGASPPPRGARRTVAAADDSSGTVVVNVPTNSAQSTAVTIGTTTIIVTPSGSVIIEKDGSRQAQFGGYDAHVRVGDLIIAKDGDRVIVSDISGVPSYEPATPPGPNDYVNSGEAVHPGTEAPPMPIELPEPDKTGSPGGGGAGTSGGTGDGQGSGGEMPMNGSTPMDGGMPMGGGGEAAGYENPDGAPPRRRPGAEPDPREIGVDPMGGGTARGVGGSRGPAIDPRPDARHSGGARVAVVPQGPDPRYTMPNPDAAVEPVSPAAPLRGRGPGIDPGGDPIATRPSGDPRRP